MLAWQTSVRDVVGGGGSTVHRKGGDLPQAAENTDTLPVLLSETYRQFNGGAQTAYAWDRALN